MTNDSRLPVKRLNLQRKLILTYVAVTVAAMLVAEGIVLGAVAWIAPWSFARPNWGLHVTLVIVVAAIAGLVLGAWGGFRRRIVTALLAIFFLGLSVTSIGLIPASAFPLAVGAMFCNGFMDPIAGGSLLAVQQATVPHPCLSLRPAFGPDPKEAGMAGFPHCLLSQGLFR